MYFGERAGARPGRLGGAGRVAGSRLACGAWGEYNPAAMEEPISIAIETSSQRGGVALGAGDGLVEPVTFRADRRHAVQVVARLEELLRRHGLRAADLAEVYVSIGPGSFTGLRVGITVARVLAQFVPALRCVAVPTAQAVAENAAGLDFENLGVVMDAGEGQVYVVLFRPTADGLAPVGPGRVIRPQRFVEQVPRPVVLIGEGLGYHRIEGGGILVGEESLWLPRAEGLWRVGRRMAAEGQFVPLAELRPLYLRSPEAVRLWERRHGGKGGGGGGGTAV